MKGLIILLLLSFIGGIIFGLIWLFRNVPLIDIIAGAFITASLIMIGRFLSYVRTEQDG